MNSKQFCSVCKQWLDMAVVPTGDDDEDDGVVWFRCPRCQGFLPKLRSQLEDAPAAEAEAAAPAAVPADADAGDAAAGAAADGEQDEDMPWDSPADMMAARGAGAAPAVEDVDADAPEEDAVDGAAAPAAAPEEEDPAVSEPVAEYAALLATKDPAAARPYRPWESYEVGDCVHHLAWDDCGVVVAKEGLPGGRHVIKCYFESAGVVRLIEKAPR